MGTLLVVDPLDLYAWGRPPQLLDDYHRGDTAYLYSAVSRAELDTLFIGSSTTAIFSSSDLQQAFPGARRAFNLSVSGPRPYDRALLSNLVLEHSPARHLLLAVDWFYVQPARQAKPDVPVYLYDEDALNDLRVASPTALRLLLRRLQGGPLALPGWDYAASSHGDDEQRWRQFQRADKLAEIRRAVTATRDLLAADSNPGCSGYDALQLQLLPFIRKALSQAPARPGHSAVFAGLPCRERAAAKIGRARTGTPARAASLPGRRGRRFARCSRVCLRRRDLDHR